MFELVEHPRADEVLPKESKNEVRPQQLLLDFTVPSTNYWEGKLRKSLTFDELTIAGSKVLLNAMFIL